MRWWVLTLQQLAAPFWQMEQQKPPLKLEAFLQVVVEVLVLFGVNLIRLLRFP